MLKIFVVPLSFVLLFLIGCNGAEKNTGMSLANAQLTADSQDYPVEIASTMHSTCVLTSQANLYCWGAIVGVDQDVNASEEMLLDFKPMPETLRNPRNLKAAAHHYCVDSDDGIKCWGGNYSGQSDVPENLGVTTQFVVTEHETCAVVDEKVICWGLGWPDVPNNITGVTSLWGGNVSVCFIASGELECPDSLASWNMPSFNPLPQEMLFGIGFSCANVENRVICWGSEDYEREKSYSFIQDFALKAGHACVVSGGVLDCWGAQWSINPVLDVVENIQGKVTRVSVGLHHACAIAENNVVCWGQDEKDRGTLDVPLELQIN